MNYGRITVWILACLTLGATMVIIAKTGGAKMSIALGTSLVPPARLQLPTLPFLHSYDKFMESPSIVMDDECSDDNVKNFPLWPVPKYFTMGNETRIVSPSLAFVADVTNPTLELAFERYRNIMFPFSIDNDEEEMDKYLQPLTTVHVSVKNMSEAHPQLDTSEDYVLTVPSNTPPSAGASNWSHIAKSSSPSTSSTTIHISSSTIYGALRALETLSQLIHFQFDSDKYTLSHCPWGIKDEPRFQHRGLMIDTARHYLPLPHIYSALDSMSYAKLNVLHWHIVDSQSFPYQSLIYPKLAKLGAFSSQERYRLKDVSNVVEYARQRGIRVVMELDVPGHASSWCQGLPQICPSNACQQPLDVSSNETFEVLSNLIKEISTVTREDFFHLGGDEVDTKCWEQVPKIASWLKLQNLTLDGGYEFFVKRAADIARSHGRRPIQWVEVFEHFGSKLDKSTIVHVWKAKSTLQKVVSAGYDAILSTYQNLYLDYLEVTSKDVYLDDPHENITDPVEKKRVLGGQAEMWGETVDPSDWASTVWPRTAAFAERMWSPQKRSSSFPRIASAHARRESIVVENEVNLSSSSWSSSWQCVLPRLEHFRCLLLSRGVAAAPVTNDKARSAPNGPGSCLV